MLYPGFLATLDDLALQNPDVQKAADAAAARDAAESVKVIARDAGTRRDSISSGGGGKLRPDNELLLVLLQKYVLVKSEAGKEVLPRDKIAAICVDLFSTLAFVFRVVQGAGCLGDGGAVEKFLGLCDAGESSTCRRAGSSEKCRSSQARPSLWTSAYFGCRGIVVCCPGLVGVFLLVTT